tara:strand:+ start:669 stop:2441 length:1773 start_codon:yes stop_codon:yes gene_type:complete
MKKALTAPDIRELVSNWQYLVGCRLEQFGRPEEDKLVLKLRSSKTGTVRLVIDFRGWLYLTKEAISTESNKGVFVNSVRKSIKKGRLNSISQLNGDRILCMEFIRGDQTSSLIFELFHKGNAILCQENKIFTLMRKQKFRHRSLSSGIEYQPPIGFNPFESNFSDFKKILIESERPLGASLTINCNLGGEISNLICYGLKIDGQSSVIESQIRIIYDRLQKILSDKIRPTIFLDEEGNNFTVSSLNLTNLKAGQEFGTFDEAIEAYLDSMETPVKETIDKDKIREDRQRKAVENYNSKAKEMREYGDFIFSNTDSVRKCIEEGKEEIPIGRTNIKIDLLKSPESNASDFFDKAKEFERKAERTKEILNVKKTKKAKKKKTKTEKLEWFENYRWFITSDNEIAVGGRDARSNEMVVKKYLKKMDRYAHADIHGAPSVVVKNNGLLPSSESMLEASSFSLAYSKAWGARVSSGHSFWVENDKVSKTPNTGEFLAKGSFVIRGKRNWNRNLGVELAIGVIDYEGNEKLMGGPLSALEKHSKKYVSFRPGFVNRKTVAKKLSDSFEIDIAEVERLLPSGGFEIKKSFGLEIKLE